MRDSYNYEGFRKSMVQDDMTFRGGPGPGELAPDFELPTVSGGNFQLQRYRHKKPVLVQFGSIT